MDDFSTVYNIISHFYTVVWQSYSRYYDFNNSGWQVGVPMNKIILGVEHNAINLTLVVDLYLTL